MFLSDREKSILRSKILSVIVTICVFFMGLPYGDEPQNVEFSYELYSEKEVYEFGDEVPLKVTAVNKGRPFKIDAYDDVSVGFFQTIDGKKVWLWFDCSNIAFDEEYRYPKAVIFKNGDTRTGVNEGTITINREYGEVVPGAYDMSVSFGDCNQVFEDVITVK